MKLSLRDEKEIQRAYYSETAQRYHTTHVNEGDEHFFGLSVMLGLADFFGIKSILDVGSGTGRAILHIATVRPDITVRGVEPVPELRDIAYSKGIPHDQLTGGDALQLQFEDGEFDLVCEFGILHHIRKPEVAIAEMLRVARKGIFICDSNNFGHGGRMARGIKQLLNACQLWPLVDFLKTRGRGYTLSEGDGLAYSYSVFSNYRQISRQCRAVHLINTLPAGANLYRSASHIALLGIKK